MACRVSKKLNGRSCEHTIFRDEGNLQNPTNSEVANEWIKLTCSDESQPRYA